MQTCHNYYTRGSALLTAMFVMTLVAIAATAMTLRLQIDIYKTELATKSDQYYLASQFVIFWGMTELKSTYKDLNKLNKNGSVAVFPEELKYHYPGMELSGAIYDLQGRFNLNNLRTKQGRKQFRILLQKLNPALEENRIQTITRSAWYWQNSFQIGRGNDSFTQAFLKEKPPTLPAHMPFVSISELRVIPGMSAEIMNRISPYITALPTETTVNINTSPKPVLATLGAGLTSEQIDKIIEKRAQKPINKPEMLKSFFEKYNISKETLGIQSNFFLIAAHATNKERTFTNYSLIQIIPDKKNKKKVRITLLRESFNTL